MDSTPIIEAILRNGSSYAMLVGVLAWLFLKYIPAREAQYQAQLSSIQETFKQSIEHIVESNERVNQAITVRLERVEDFIRKKF